jgi:Leucine-rich repeat (LRR) protein
MHPTIVLTKRGIVRGATDRHAPYDNRSTKTMSYEDADSYLAKLVARRIAAVRNRETDTLELVKLSLSSIPEDVFDLATCRKLVLSSDAVIDMSSVYLDEEYWWETSFDNNLIASIPPAVGRMKNLEVLEIDQNMLYGLPSEIGELRRLRELRLRNNNIGAIPPEIGDLASLEVLDLSFNWISRIPPEIGRLHNLRHLDLSCNLIAELPEEMAALENLEYLSVANYDANEVFADTAERFDLNQNKIERLPSFLARLPNLEEFHCEHNPLDSFVLDEIERNGAIALSWVVEEDDG